MTITRILRAVAPASICARRCLDGNQGLSDGCTRRRTRPTRYRSSTIVPKGRTWNIAVASPQELRETIEAGSAHAGRYELDASPHSVNIENGVSLNPADTGPWDAVHARG